MADAKEQYREQLKVEIHSLLCTEKHPIPAFQLLRNYRELMTCSIIWTKLGYKSLDQLLKSMTDIVHCTSNANGQLMVSAVPREESVHINELVAGQKHRPFRPNNKNHTQHHNGNKKSFAHINNNRQTGNGLLPIPASLNRIPSQNQNGNFRNAPNYNQQSQMPMMSNQSNLREWVNQPQQQPSVYQSPLEPVQAVEMPALVPAEDIESSTQQSSVEQVDLERSSQSPWPNQLPKTQGEEQSTIEQVERSTTSSRPRPGVDMEKLRKLMAKKLKVSQSTSTEPNYQRDEQTQTVETLQTLSRLDGSPKSDKDCQCPEPELTPRVAEVSRELPSRASTEQSISLPTISYSNSPTLSVTSQLTSLSRMGDTTFVRVIPPALPLVNRSQTPIVPPVNTKPSVRIPKKKENEETFYLEQLQHMSKRGVIGSVSLRHLRLANGRYRAFISVDGMEFSTQPTDFVQYTDAYAEAARRACLHFQSLLAQHD